MNSLKRVTITIERNFKKAFLFFCLLFILGTIVSGAVIIRQAASQSEERLWLQAPRLVTLGWDTYSLKELGMPEPITPAIVEELGALPQIQSYHHAIPVQIVLENAVFYHDPSASHTAYYEELFMGRERWINALGVNNSIFPELESGLIQLTEGRTFEVDDVQVAIISREFAQLNQLIVGSILQLSTTSPEESPYGSPFTEQSPLNVFEVKVTGIFDLYHDFDTTLEAYDRHRREQLLNQMYIPLKFGEILYEQKISYLSQLGGHFDFFSEVGWEYLRNRQLQIHTSLYLYNLRDLEAFRQGAVDILPEGWRVEDYSEIMFPQMLTVIDNLNHLTHFILVGAVGAVTLITILLIFLYLKDIKNEIGIYLSLGEQKVKSWLRLLLEVFIISFTAMTLAIFSGQMISRYFSQTMIRDALMREESPLGEEFLNQIIIGSEAYSFRLHNPGNMSFDDMMSTFEISLNVPTILIIYLIGIGVVIFSTSLASIYIWKLPPKSILLA